MCLIMLLFLMALPALTYTLARIGGEMWLIAGLIAWALVIAAIDSYYRKKFVRVIALAFLLSCLVVALLGRNFFDDFYANIITELASIAATVLIIDTLRERAASRREKRDLLLQFGSRSNDFALEAARRLKISGGLFDGSLRGAKLWGANLQGADLEKVNLHRCILWGANLQGARLWDANLREAHLEGADLRKAELSSANLQGAHLRLADLREAHLQGANLQGADLMAADLQEAELHEADLQGAELYEADLQGALYNKSTIWPDGFDPEAAGCELLPF